VGWEGQIGQLKPGFYADVVALLGNPLDDISSANRVRFSLGKNGAIVRNTLVSMWDASAGYKVFVVKTSPLSIGFRG
jgi:hypothetical protein